MDLPGDAPVHIRCKLNISGFGDKVAELANFTTSAVYLPGAWCAPKD